jgi:hypothetical protein
LSARIICSTRPCREGRRPRQTRAQLLDFGRIEIDILASELDDTGGATEQALELRRRDALIAQRHLPVEGEQGVGVQEARGIGAFRLEMHRQARPQQPVQGPRQRPDAHQAQRGQRVEEQGRQCTRFHGQRFAGTLSHVVTQGRMELGQHRYRREHLGPPLTPSRFRQHLGQWRRRLRRGCALCHGERQREAVAFVLLLQAQHRDVRARGQVQAGEPGVDAAGDGGLARAVEVGTSCLEEERHNLVGGSLLRGGAVRRGDEVVQQGRQQEASLHERVERFLPASRLSHHEPWRQRGSPSISRLRT